MKLTFPSLENTSSADTYRLIENAKKEMRMFRIFTLSFIFGLIIWSSAKIGEVFDIEMVQGLSGWVLFICAIFAGHWVTKAIEKIIIKKQITKQVNAA